MFESRWSKRKQNNLIVLGVLAATLLAVFWASGEWQKVWSRVWRKLWKSATIRWEKIPNGSHSNAETLNSDFRRRTENTEKEILDLIKNLQGIYGVYVEDLETGASFGINQDQVFTAASLIKLPVFVAVYQEIEKGSISLDTKYQILDTDKVSGAGSMYYQPAGTLYTYEEMLELMGKQSDNTAFNVFVKLLGEKKIQTVIDGLGMSKTSFVENETTAENVGRFFRELYRGNLPAGRQGQVNRKNQGEMLSYLTDTSFEERIPAGIPDEVRVAHKVGTEIGVISDAGIVFGERPFVLVIMSEGVKESEAKEVLPKIAEIVWKNLGAQ